MAQTTGLVQKLTILSTGAACVWIGPTPNNTEVLVVQANSLANTLIDALAGAATNYRQVVANHPSSSAEITSLTLESI